MALHRKSTSDEVPSELIPDMALAVDLAAVQPAKSAIAVEDEAPPVLTFDGALPELISNVSSSTGIAAVQHCFQVCVCHFIRTRRGRYTSELLYLLQ